MSKDQSCRICRLRGVTWRSLSTLWNSDRCWLHLGNEDREEWKGILLRTLQQSGDLRHQDYKRGDASSLDYLAERIRPEAPVKTEEFYDYYLSKLDFPGKKRKINSKHPAKPPKYISLAGADLSNLNLSGVSLELVDLRGASLEGTKLDKACLRFSNLAGANLSHAKLKRAILSNCIFEDCEMVGVNLAEAVADGANFKNARLRGAVVTAARLQRADFSNADLEKSAFHGAQLSGAKFDNSSAAGANFSEANLQESTIKSASFAGAKLTKANLLRADLTGSNFTKANLAESDLEDAILDDTEFSNADLRGAVLKGVNLHKAILNRTRVFYESLRLATFLSSSLTDNSFVLERMKKVRVFISYSHGDGWFAERLEEALREKSIDVWIDKNEILVGDSLLGRIREGIDSSDFVCALISHFSISSSWVQSELEIALNQQIEAKKVKVLPLMLQEGIKLPLFLVGKLYIDFSRREYFDDGVKQIMRRLDRESLSDQLFDGPVKDGSHHKAGPEAPKRERRRAPVRRR